MSARDLIQEALHSLEANKGRSLLTILGIVIGIASVIAMTSLIGGIQNRMVTARSASAAMPGSCVISTMVLPRFWSLWKVSITSAPVAESRFPVGSSARMKIAWSTAWASTQLVWFRSIRPKNSPILTFRSFKN